MGMRGGTQLQRLCFESLSSSTSVSSDHRSLSSSAHHASERHLSLLFFNPEILLRLCFS